MSDKNFTFKMTFPYCLEVVCLLLLYHPKEKLQIQSQLSCGFLFSVASVPESWSVHSWSCSQTVCTVTLQPH